MIAILSFQASPWINLWHPSMAKNNLERVLWTIGAPIIRLERITTNSERKAGTAASGGSRDRRRANSENGDHSFLSLYLSSSCSRRATIRAVVEQLTMPPSTLHLDSSSLPISSMQSTDHTNPSEHPAPSKREKVWFKSTKKLIVEGEGQDEVIKVWFKSEPLNRSFTWRVVQLQLSTQSHDQGFVDDSSRGNFTWFEIALFPDSEATEPRRGPDGAQLVWKSHNNQLANSKGTLHFGTIFDRRSELLSLLNVCLPSIAHWQIP